MVEARLAARSARDYVTADRMRDELAALGVAVQHRADGPAWQRTGQADFAMFPLPSTLASHESESPAP